MLLEDFETKERITNPYIAIHSIENAWVALNINTFHPAMKKVMDIDKELKYLKYCLLGGERLYKILTIRSKKEIPKIYEWENPFTKGANQVGTEDAMALFPLGYLLEDIVRELFPESYKYFEKKRVASEISKM